VNPKPPAPPMDAILINWASITGDLLRKTVTTLISWWVGLNEHTYITCRFIRWIIMTMHWLSTNYLWQFKININMCIRQYDCRMSNCQIHLTQFYERLKRFTVIKLVFNLKQNSAIRCYTNCYWT